MELKKPKTPIPTLTKKEHNLFEQGLLGFKSKDNCIILTPSDIGALWFHAQFFDTKTMSEHYTKRPMALSRIVNLDPYYMALKNNKIKAFKTDPKPLTYNERDNYKAVKRKTNVYIIQSVIGGPVKIGKAYNVEKRLKEHQTGSPYILKVIKVFKNVEHKFETQLHKKFKPYRLHGEWFDEKILTII